MCIEIFAILVFKSAMMEDQARSVSIAVASINVLVSFVVGVVC